MSDSLNLGLEKLGGYTHKYIDIINPAVKAIIIPPIVPENIYESDSSTTRSVNKSANLPFSNFHLSSIKLLTTMIDSIMSSICDPLDLN